MATYKLTTGKWIHKLDEDIRFAIHAENPDYQEYLAWLELGNTPIPADIPIEEYVSAVQYHMEDAARAKGYDNLLSATSYAVVPGPFQAESIAFAQWRSDCWAYCHQQLALVQSASRATPTVAELVAELPALVIPT